jgi:hypothetical protein
LSFWTGMKTWITAVEENGCTLRLACEQTVSGARKGYDFDAYRWPWMKTDWYMGGQVNVKCTLVQALRLCTGRTAHRGSRGIALL